MEVLRRNLLLALLLVSSCLIGICSSCGVEDEALIEYRRHQFDRLLLEQNRRALNETIGANGSTQEPTSAPTVANPKLLFHGRVLNESREPLVNAQVQFWHADWHGNYLHPGDNLNGFDLMTDTFSYFGTATTGSNGTFDFITYRPGIYSQRPVTHIHFKVFVNGTEVLTSQFYWEDEGVSRWKDEMLILSFNQTVDEDGNAAVFTEKEIVVNTKGRGYSGGANLTPRDMEGPFYPLLDFFEVGPDMTSKLLVRYQAQALNTIIETLAPSAAPSRMPITTASPSAIPTAMPIDNKDKNKNENKNKDKNKNKNKNKTKDKNQNPIEEPILPQETVIEVADGSNSNETSPFDGEWPSTALLSTNNEPRLPKEKRRKEDKDDKRQFLRRDRK